MKYVNTLANIYYFIYVTIMTQKSMTMSKSQLNLQMHKYAKYHFSGWYINDMKRIEDNFMAHNTDLRDLDMVGQSEVEKIGNNFLFGCIALRKINFTYNTKLREIGNDFLRNCRSLDTIILSSFSQYRLIKNAITDPANGLDSLKTIKILSVTSAEPSLYFHSVTRKYENAYTLGYMTFYRDTIFDDFVLSKSPVTNHYKFDKFEDVCRYIHRTKVLYIRKHSKNKFGDAFGIWNVMANVSLFLD